jgi:3-hydroxybutyryl-CoA dehydrogenase
LNHDFCFNLTARVLRVKRSTKREGFVSLANTLVAPLLADAEALASADFATAQDINTAMKLGAGHPHGPLPEAAGSAPTDDPAIDVPTAVAVIGTGTMATGMVEVFARAGADTKVVGLTRGDAENVVASVGRRLQRAVDADKLSADTRTETLSRIKPAAGLQSCAGSDFAIEAITEDLGLKRALFEQLERATKTIPLATNTSSFRIGQISDGLLQPERVFAFHFFNPAPAMRLVEVVPGQRSETDLVSRGAAWARGIGKVPVTCRDDTGFIVNRLLVPYLNDAARTCSESHIDWADADFAVRDELAHPMGPFELMDLIGLDVMLSAVKAMHDRFETDRFAPAAALAELAQSGRLGRKSGAGFYEYEGRR